MPNSIPRVAFDNVAVSVDWSGPVYKLLDIYSLYYYILGGDIRIRWATYDQSPNFNDLDPDGELVRGNADGSFDRLDNDHGCFQFKLNVPTVPATLDFKAQRKSQLDGDN